MLPEKDRKEYKQGMYDLYVEVGTTKILYYALDEDPESENIYLEKEKTYKEPINLVGVIIPYQPSEDGVMYATNIDKVLLKFDIIGLSIEKTSLNPYEMITGLFEFEGKKYSIVKMTPKGLFTDFYTSYEFVGELI